MTKMPRDLVLVIAVAVLAVFGAVVEAASDGVEAPPAEPVTGERFFERASYCLPPLGPRGAARTVVGTVNDEPTTIGIDPGLPNPVDLSPGNILVHDLGDSPVRVVGFGAPAYASAQVVQRGVVEAANRGPWYSGIGAANCATDAATTWYLPGGSSALKNEERIVLFNPFPDEAVVEITFLTPNGERAKANLDDIGVPAGQVVQVEVNRFILEQAVLAAQVDALRGRVVAWKALSARPVGAPPGLQLTLGSTRTSDTWYFPDGVAGDGFDERISVMNPTREDARINISLLTGEEVVQPPRLAELTVPPRSSKSFNVGASLPERRSDLGGISAFVQSTNGVQVVAERTVKYDGGGLTGAASEIGARESALEWLVGPASFAPSLDAVVVMNTGAAPARVSVSLLRPDGSPLRPEELQSIQIAAGLRRRIALEKWTEGAPFVALVTSESQIVAERWSFSTNPILDPSAVMGVPLPE